MNPDSFGELVAVRLNITRIFFFNGRPLGLIPHLPFTSKALNILLILAGRATTGFTLRSIHESEVQVLQKSIMNLTLSTGSLLRREETGLWENMKLPKIPVI